MLARLPDTVRTAGVALLIVDEAHFIKNPEAARSQTVKAAIDSKYAAIYYPWVIAPNPDFNPNDANADAEVDLLRAKLQQRREQMDAAPAEDSKPPKPRKPE